MTAPLHLHFRSPRSPWDWSSSWENVAREQRERDARRVLGDGPYEGVGSEVLGSQPLP